MTTSLNQPNIPLELISELAKGIEDPKDVAFRYGITSTQLDELAKWEPFQKALAAKKAEFAQSGITTRLDAQLKYEALSDQLFKMALTNDSTFNQKLSALEHFGTMADLKPKASAQVQAGPGFSISINLTAPPTPAKQTEKTVNTVEAEVITLEPTVNE